jgi:hypothetical protein
MTEKVWAVATWGIAPAQAKASVATTALIVRDAVGFCSLRNFGYMLSFTPRFGYRGDQPRAGRGPAPDEAGVGRLQPCDKHRNGWRWLISISQGVVWETGRRIEKTIVHPRQGRYQEERVRLGVQNKSSAPNRPDVITGGNFGSECGRSLLVE